MKKIENLNLDIIHTQTEFSIGVFGRIMAKRLDIPVVHTYHTMYEDYMHYITNNTMLKYASNFAKKASKFYCQKYDKVIAPTVKTKNALKSYGLNNDIEVIPTGIKLKKFKKENHSEQVINELKRKFNIKPNQPVILYIGRIAREKSIDIILKEFPKLLDKIPNAKFLIVGDGPVKSDLESLTRKLNIASSVIFTGEKPWEEIGKYYQLGDVFVSASTTETQGLTFIEAMASKTPVLAKYDTNLDDMLEDKVNGRVFYKDKNLSDILIEILKNKYGTELMVKRAYQDVQSISAIEFGKKVEKIYSELLYKKEIIRDKDLLWIM
jgi:1,2-diacylglycerol 3-alpha-glucosyltransferase